MCHVGMNTDGYLRLPMIGGGTGTIEAISSMFNDKVPLS